MSSFHYTREAGADGQIITGEGNAPGIGLDFLLDRERPPLRAALEIGSAMADILCIAAEDQAIHGDIRPAHVKVDDRGALSVEGYGVTRRVTRAPEGRPDTSAADIFGLGVVLHSILSTEAMGSLPTEPDAHDDEVVSRVLSMDFSSVQGKRWLEEVRTFLCQILAHQPGERPAPLDAANVLASVAAQCPGESLPAWSKRLASAGSRPAAPRPAAAPTLSPPSEDLGGPVALTGPFSRGGVRVAPSSKGESTAFWSREKIAAMLADDDDEDTVPPTTPRRSAPTHAPAIAPPQPTPPPPAAPPLPPPAPAPAPPPPPPKPRAVEPIAGPRADATWRSPPPTAEEASEEKKSGGMIIAMVVIIVLLAVICGLLVLGGGGAWFYTSKEPVDVVDAPPTKPKPEIEPPGPPDDPPAVAAPAPRAPTSPRPAASATPATSKAPRATATPAPAPVPTAAPPPPPEPAAGSYSVKISTPGREAKVQCGDGQSAEFTGGTTLQFSGTVTCLVRMGQGRGPLQVSHSASVTCSEDGGRVTCTGS